MALLAAIYLALYLAAVYWTADFVSPALVICVLLALMTTAYGFIVFHFPLRHFGVVFLLVAGYFGVASYVSKQYQFAGLDYGRPTVLAQVDVGPEQSGLLPNDRQDDDDGVLNRWRGQFSQHWPGQFPPNQKPVLVVVATKGGGARAAAWTTAVLARLEEDLPRLPYHVRLISGASGGMLGAAYYVATLNPPGSEALHTVSSEQLVNRISLDSLSPVVRHLALPLRGDRGEALEQAWEKNTQGALARPLADLRRAESAGWCPSLVFAPMLVEDGRRLVISNLDLALLVNERTSLLREGHWPNEPSQQFWDCAVGMAVLRAVSLRHRRAAQHAGPNECLVPVYQPRRRAGHLAAAAGSGRGLLRRLWREPGRTVDSLLPPVAHREHVRSGADPDSRPGAQPRPRGPLIDARLAEGLVALYYADRGGHSRRDATMSYRNDELVHIVSEDLRQQKDPEFFRTFVFEFSEDAPFSWYLPPENRDRLKKEVARSDSGFAREAQALREWWGRREGR